MNARTVYLTGLMLAVLQAGAGRAQEPAALAPMPTPLADPSVPTEAPAAHSGHGLSPWVLYSHGDCCGPIGKHGPVWMEVYGRSGASFPVGGSVLASRLDPGWFVQGGGRSLFFDRAEVRAWTIDLSISNDFKARKPGAAPIVAVDRDTMLPELVGVRIVNRTYANLALGREFYIIGSASAADWCWRVGGDVGIRWGTSRMDVDDPTNLPAGFARHNSWSWGQVGAVHSDVEIPLGCAFLDAGVRVEYGATYQPRLTHTSTSNQINDINVLGTLGIRY